MNVPLDVQTLEYVIRRRVEEGTAQLASQPCDTESVRKLNRLLDLVGLLPFKVSLWEAQNTAYVWLSKAKPESQPESEEGASSTKSCAQETASLKEKLGLQIP